ncbi:DUF3511 domain-containing protein [Citrus sinensis]|uniref:DUF3511 domain-containing protein n=1 Tax=Citrus clementina TaxID=85681 RepID=V4U110_CITCL|nr:uncharacterized protein LOC18049107 [Citrus x clementina]XP_006480043.2 uncharacterized protein LOC102625735 [Citrus sinensis]ESR57690.1 hypothetical protein CICLE_v10022952mg [Citrus x clementina]KAH9730674.1 DUF3511 domain-containing protein [Citrus sinensis]
MDGYRYGSGQRPYGGDRRLEIVSVSGKSFTSAAVGGNQIYATHDLPQIPPRMPRQSHDASLKPWGFTDPEMKRRKRIAKYKVYTVEGKVKASLRKGLRWIKNKCFQIVHGC